MTIVEGWDNFLQQFQDLYYHISIRSQEDRYMMDKWTFGFTMVVVGMGGTICTLIVFSLIMSALKKIFPYKKEEDK